MSKKTWHIRDLETKESIDTIEVSADMSERLEEKLLRAILMRIDIERFYVDTE